MDKGKGRQLHVTEVPMWYHRLKHRAGTFQNVQLA